MPAPGHDVNSAERQFGTGTPTGQDERVHAVLQSLGSPALEPDTLDSFAPPVADDFGIALSAQIGPSEGEGADVFYLTVCSPTWLARASMFENSKGFEFVRHRLVIERWDAELIRRAVTDLCLHTSGADWHDVAVKLSRYLYWEFEDYVTGSA